jgi:alkanesulfonate monooxygenase SsuD/methylene tetrahydromethanopterin reductase-like flavin-dependent oxidoreductase (luciferase family)
MKLGLHLGYWGSSPTDVMPLVLEAERLGFDSVWSAEAYGSDAVSTIAWVAARTERIGVGTAVMQIPARTPAATAMTAITLDHLSGGRFRLGLGMSGPQVVEGWHGMPYGRPLARTREYVHVVREILRREKPVEYAGEYYEIPAERGTGLGKPLKTIVHPLRPDLPIYLAAIGPRNVALAAEIADGWLPTIFAPSHMHAFEASLKDGFARSNRDPSLQSGGPLAATSPSSTARPRATPPNPPLDIAPMCPVMVGADVQACRDMLKPYLALYVGGMGARGRNFYADLVGRYGYEAEAARIQDLYLEGRKGEAAGAVPDALVDETALVGPPERIRDGLAAWRAAGIGTLIAVTTQPEALRALADAGA